MSLQAPAVESGATGLASPGVLHPDWYREIAVSGVNPELPGLYEWWISGVGCYIGQYTHARRPRREYGLNVGKLHADRPYRKGNPNGFREIHKALHRAVVEERTVTLTLLENQTEKSDRNRRERELIAERRERYRGTNFQILNSN